MYTKIVFQEQVGFKSEEYIEKNSRKIGFILKRSLDLCLCLLLFPLFLFLYFTIGVLIKITSPGPILFKQKRVGYRGKPFYIYKFRTMYKDSEKILNNLLKNCPLSERDWRDFRKLRRDPRITPIGKFLRQTSLDELPQIINVLKGEMSFVGPRPVTEEELNLYYGDRAHIVLSVLPGITGLWQVSGRNLLTYQERVNLDVEYVLKQNILLDIEILIKTIPAVITGKGAN